MSSDKVAVDLKASLEALEAKYVLLRHHLEDEV